MDKACPSQDQDSDDFQLQVDFFRKLGYSATEVRCAIQNLGLNVDTNSVLGELVQARKAPVSNAEMKDMAALHTAPIAGLESPQRAQRDTPQFSLDDRRDGDGELNPIVIDGSNVAMSHGNKEVFSCRGIELAVNFFLDRGHTAITVFVPSWRKEQPRPDAPITDQHILTELEREKIVVFTPSRRVGGKRVVCYDDRFIIKLAHDTDGVIVSNDTYRDLQGERPEWKKCIEERLLMYSFVNDKFMPPDDPLGRHGPSLDNFLRKNPLPSEQKRQLCPYDKKCTYGIKCKFYHPERTQQSYRSLADELRDNACLSTVKEDRNTKVSQRWPQTDLGSSGSSYRHTLEHDLEHRLVLGRHSPLQKGHVNENQLLYWDRPLNSGHQFTRDSGGFSQHDWPAMPRPLSNSDQPYVSISHKHLDSGLGSYESQYSDAPHGLSKPLRSRPQQGLPPSPWPRLPAMHLDRQDIEQPCRCCSHITSSAGPQKHYSYPNLEPHSQPRYNTYPTPQFPPSIHHYSLPSHFQDRGPPQQKCWSDPFQGMPQTRTSCSLPSPLSSPACHGHSCPYQEQPSWGCPMPQPSAFDPDREELRKKLQAIFNPHHVDMVMGMFPHLRDSQKLAAEILTLRSQGGAF
ncbi:endoribonuclease ZC3H12A isoform X1 [Osmerus mordax]|uniref:endoribonuclease ZC3H12A isoform X1 n=2 Tax=Osmerus mordax TaxID=8014 RepID=UPI00350F5172